MHLYAVYGFLVIGVVRFGCDGVVAVADILAGLVVVVVVVAVVVVADVVDFGFSE